MTTSAHQTLRSGNDPFVARGGPDAHAQALQRESALGSLLLLHPDAPIGAFREDGVSVPLPEALADGRPVIEGVALGLVHPEHHAAAVAGWDQVLMTGTAQYSVHLADDPDTRVVCHAFDVRAIYGALVVVVIASDQSAEVIATERVLSALPKLATVSKDERANLIGVDEALTQILGWSADEMVGRPSLEFVHPDDQALAIENWMEMLVTPGPGRRVRMRYTRRDEAWVWFEITNHNQLDDPDHPCVVSGMVDITAEMATHEALRAREELLDRLAEAIPVGLVQIDAVRHVVYTNDRLHQIVGVKRSETMRQQLSSVLSADHAVLDEAIDTVLRRGSASDVEVQLRSPRGELRRCAISLRALSDDTGATNGAIACVTDITESARMREELHQRATFDDLTGCYNRASLMRALEEQVASHDAATGPSVIFIDLDRFKQVNDRHGHACGNELLRVVARRIRQAVRAHDIVGRIGGDEFLVVLPDTKDPTQAVQLAHRLAAALRTDVRLGDFTVSNQASIGIACPGPHHAAADTLIARADRAMYDSKRQGNGEPSLADQVLHDE